MCAKQVQMQLNCHILTAWQKQKLRIRNECDVGDAASVTCSEDVMILDTVTAYSEATAAFAAADDCLIQLTNTSNMHVNLFCIMTRKSCRHVVQQQMNHHRHAAS